VVLLPGWAVAVHAAFHAGQLLPAPRLHRSKPENENVLEVTLNFYFSNTS
jgi:hypothetical protein